MQVTLIGEKIPEKRYSMEGCEYCNKITKHEIIKLPHDNGNGGDLKCTVCGSYRLWKIQGFDAQLM